MVTTGNALQADYTGIIKGHIIAQTLPKIKTYHHSVSLSNAKVVKNAPD